MGSSNRRARYRQYAICGEGNDECVFFRYLASIYMDTISSLKIVNGLGGTPAGIVKRFRNLPQFSAYQEHMVVFDSDRSDERIRVGKERCLDPPKIQCLLSDCRFEIEIFRIMGYPQHKLSKFTTNNSEPVKEEFCNLCNRYSGGAEEMYRRRFTKEVLEKARKTNNWLNVIISFMEECDTDVD